MSSAWVADNALFQRHVLLSALLDIPLIVRLAAIFAMASGVASLANAAIYAWSWERRLVSPWQRPAEGVGPRSWWDRVPIWGWWRLRRDESLLGRRFWVRPLCIEFGFATAIAALYWWEVDQLGLIALQLTDLFHIAPPAPSIDPAPIAGVLHMQFASHALLATLMTIATFIDFDERIIPDEITFPGTLIGLLLVTLAPCVLLPNVEKRFAAPVSGVALEQRDGGRVIAPNGEGVYLEPAHVAAPGQWPALLAGGQRRISLAIGLGCFWLWCFALTDRRWPRCGPTGKKLRLVLARIHRDLTRRPLRESLIAGTLLIAMVWFAGGDHWLGLLSALVGMAVGGMVVWAVRIIGTAVLRREAMGFGDVTLMMMVGAFLGWQACPIIFFLAPAAGLVLAILNLVLHGDKAIPFGPFLCLAAMFVIVRWADVWVAGEVIFAQGWLVPAVLTSCFVLLAVLLGLLEGLKALMGIKRED